MNEILFYIKRAFAAMMAIFILYFLFVFGAFLFMISLGAFAVLLAYAFVRRKFFPNKSTDAEFIEIEYVDITDRDDRRD